MVRPNPDLPRVALMGAGRWGSNVLRALQQLGCLQLVCDIDPDRVAAVSGVAVACDPAEVLATTDIDAVVVATPPRTHRDLTLMALEAGKHVLVEKPLALTVEDGCRMRDAARAAGLVLMADHVLEYHPAVTHLLGLVRSGELGRVRYVYSHRLNLGQVRTDENALWSFAPHDVGLILSIAGEPRVVSSRGGAWLTPGVADVTLTAIGFDGGVEAHVFVSWLHPFKEQRFVVVGDEKMAVFDDTAPWAEKLTLFPHRVHWVGGTVPVAQKAEGVPVPIEEAEPLVAACQHFLDCIRHGTEPRTGADYAIRVLEVLDWAERSLADRGSPVDRADIDAFAQVSVHPTAIVDDGAEVGAGTRIWHHAHVMSGAVIGRDCVLGQNTFVARGVRVGDRVKLQNNVSVFEGVELEDGVFCGPSAVFTNVLNPRAEVERKDEYLPTLVGRGATIGANATIVCGNQIGHHAMVAAGAVVTHDVAPHGLVAGAPARAIGWVCECGEVLAVEGGKCRCHRCQQAYLVEGDTIWPSGFS